MSQADDLLKSLEHLSAPQLRAPQLRRLLTEQLTRQKLGLYWESSAIERDAALNARRKGQHLSSTYGKVLFLTKDAQRFKIVQDNGSLGEVVDFANLARLRQWMRDSAPA
ncbi:MAG: hypothetical protein JWR68_6 [Polaromonas sp.]|nr:hypothetical protein [Polaromonas sp.]